jgi:hypothetical protein
LKEKYNGGIPLDLLSAMTHSPAASTREGFTSKMLPFDVLTRIAAATFNRAGRVLRPFGLDCCFTPCRLWHGDDAGWFACMRLKDGVAVAVGRGEVVFSRA